MDGGVVDEHVQTAECARPFSRQRSRLHRLTRRQRRAPTYVPHRRIRRRRRRALTGRGRQARRLRLPARNCSAVARPIPRAAPVTKAVRSVEGRSVIAAPRCAADTRRAAILHRCFRLSGVTHPPSPSGWRARSRLHIADRRRNEAARSSLPRSSASRREAMGVSRIRYGFVAGSGHRADATWDRSQPGFAELRVEGGQVTQERCSSSAFLAAVRGIANE